MYTIFLFTLKRWNEFLNMNLYKEDEAVCRAPIPQTKTSNTKLVRSSPLRDSEKEETFWAVAKGRHKQNFWGMGSS